MQNEYQLTKYYDFLLCNKAHMNYLSTAVWLVENFAKSLLHTAIVFLQVKYFFIFGYLLTRAV